MGIWRDERWHLQCHADFVRLDDFVFGECHTILLILVGWNWIFSLWFCFLCVFFYQLQILLYSVQFMQNRTASDFYCLIQYAIYSTDISQSLSIQSFRSNQISPPLNHLHTKRKPSHMVWLILFCCVIFWAVNFLFVFSILSFTAVFNKTTKLLWIFCFEYLCVPQTFKFHSMSLTKVSNKVQLNSDRFYD